MAETAKKTPPYVLIWVILVLAVVVSTGISDVGHPTLATALIFGIATFKAFLVGSYYMHLKWEPKYITWILLGAALVIFVFFFALVPDIVFVYGD